MIPDETSIVCELCSVFNFSDGRIINGKTYCEDCYIENKERLDDTNTK